VSTTSVNTHVRSAVQDERYGAGGGREYRLFVDVVAGQFGASRLVGPAVADLQNVVSIPLSGGDVVVVDEFGVPTLTDQPFLRKR
jgi:hypothetical protein